MLFAPLSGHYASLLRDTVKTLLPGADVYITNWKNARDVPISAGKFDQDDYISYAEEFIRHVGPDAHVMAVCQPTFPVMAALSMIAEDTPDQQPCSITMVAGPLDVDAAPSQPSKFTNSVFFEPFMAMSTSTVPYQYAGAGRSVHMGMAQLYGFMAPNLSNHWQKTLEFHKNIREGNMTAIQKQQTFDADYFAVMDMTSECIVQTCERTFRNAELARGTLKVNGRLIDPSAITAPLFTIEGSKDDISPVGQTKAVHRLCPQIPAENKFHHEELGAGHYGTFSGSRWRNNICPRIANFVHQQGEKAGHSYDSVPKEIGHQPIEHPKNYRVIKSQNVHPEIACPH